MRFFSKKLKFLIIIVIVIAVVLLMNFFQKEVRNFFYSISFPVQRTFWQAGDNLSDFLKAIIRTKSLKNEVDELVLKNQELLAQVVTLSTLKEENETLRKALEIELQKDFKLTLAQIISKDISSDFILIDKGADDGISKDMPVITETKILLGKVSEVYKNFSKVMLISNKESFFDVNVIGSLNEIKQEEKEQEEIEQEKKDICGIIKGGGNLKILLDFIPRDKEVCQGDIVVTSSLRGVFPVALLVGQVREIRKKDIESFQQGEIEPFFNLERINYLFVITEY